jgi:cysteine desulfurase
MDPRVIFGLCTLVLIILIVLFMIKSQASMNVFTKYYYFDNNGTTPLNSDALSEMNRCMYLGNASSSYSDEAKRVLEDTTKDILSWVKSPTYRVIFTSCGSESNNTIMRQPGKKVISSIEHKTSIEADPDNTILVAPDINGIIQPAAVVSAITPDTTIISIMHSNNETGVINPIADIVKAIKVVRPDIIFHTDAVQTFGKYSIPMELWGIDALSASGHKLYGPLGVGLLIISPQLADKLQPLIAGSQNSHLRGGTENIPAIAAFRVALKKTTQNRCAKNKKLIAMKQYLMYELTKIWPIGDVNKYYGMPDETISNRNEVVFIGSNALQIPNTILVAFIKGGPMEKHFCNVELKKYLHEKGFIISIGSACNTSGPPSHVLKALQLPYIVRCGVIRISMSENNSIDECKKLINAIKDGCKKQGMN